MKELGSDHIEYSVSKKFPNYIRNLDEFEMILYLNGFSISFDQNACRSFPKKKHLRKSGQGDDISSLGQVTVKE